ncbi:MAG: ATP-binding protein [Eggerthellaceae bacterium]|nr:ATP-binding protein [Eggerthellaceae bacterium]
MFVGRKRELSFLKERYQTGKFEFVGVYGRRRVGKTALLTEFTRPLKTGWCAAVEDDAALNLRILSQAVHMLLHPDFDPDLAPVYPDFQRAVEAAFDAARDDRAVLVIDDFPYLAKSYPAFPSVLQASIDAHKDTSKLFLVLCGSSLSFMKEQLLDKKSPLYGRRTAQLELKPFDYFESRAFFPDADPVTAANIYGMVGGVPLYLLQFDASRSLEQNVECLFLNPGSILYEEPLNLLKQEVSKASPYNAVISAIAGGASQHNEISRKAGLESGALDYYLKELMRLGLLTKEEPMTGKGGRKALWRLTDNLFRFWYHFVRPRQPLAERGLGAKAAPGIAGALSEYMGLVFEGICRDWIWRQVAAEALEFDVTDVGRWWGNDPVAHEEAEIDIVAVDGSTTVMVGECKWKNEPTGADQLEKLDGRARLVGAESATARWLFSRARFTQGCQESASGMSGARLVTFDEMALDA